MGYSHIPQKRAAAVNRFYTDALNTYLNFHRPRYFAVDTIDAKRKIKKPTRTIKSKRHGNGCKRFPITRCI